MLEQAGRQAGRKLSMRPVEEVLARGDLRDHLMYPCVVMLRQLNDSRRWLLSLLASRATDITFESVVTNCEWPRRR